MAWSKTTETQNEMDVVLQLNQGYDKLLSVAIETLSCFLNVVKLGPSLWVPRATLRPRDVRELALLQAAGTDLRAGGESAWGYELECELVSLIGSSRKVSLVVPPVPLSLRLHFIASLPSTC